MPPSVTSNDANGTLKRAMSGCVRSDDRVGNEESESSIVDGTLLGRPAGRSSHRQCHPESNDPGGQKEAMRIGIWENLTSDRFMHQTNHELFFLGAFSGNCYPIPRHRQKDFVASGASFV